MALNKPYSNGPYNKFDDKEQWIRLSEGCPHNCPFCYEPKKKVLHAVPDIIRNDVKIMDMNLLCKKEALKIIRKLGDVRVNSRVVYYQFICGIDFRFLTPEMAEALKGSRFKKLRIAWDWGMKDQYKLKVAIQTLIRAGYNPRYIQIFMICNWKISQVECMQKLDLCKVWGVQVADCYFDGQVSPGIKPVHWTDLEIKMFRRKCRKHNQLINFRVDPEIKQDSIDT